MSYNKETGMYEGFIYCITNIINNKLYIGQTKQTISIRFKQHITFKSKYDTCLNRALKKYGIQHFKVEELFKCECKEREDLTKNLNKKERLLINEYNSLVPNGYNMVKGGGCGLKAYAEKPVSQYDIDGNFVKQYCSMAEASRITGFNQSDISYCCMKKKVKIVGGYRWCYANEKIDLTIKPLKYTRVCQYDMYGNLLNMYKSISTAGKETNIDAANIDSCCRNKARSAGGFVWRYNQDSFDKYRTPKIKQSIYMINPYGELINVFRSMEDGAKYINGSSSNISLVCNHKKKTHYGFIWRFENNILDEYIIIKGVKVLDRFIYTQDIKIKEYLINKHFNLIKEIPNKNTTIYIFENKPNEVFEFEETNKCVFSNTLSF
jgi:hypothetical protein